MIKQEENLLNRIYRDTKMGEENIAVVLRALDDTALRYELITEMEGYATLNTRAKKMLYERRSFPEEQSCLAKAMTAVMLRVRTASLSSPEEVAQMMIKGNRMGIEAASRELRRCGDRSSPVYDLTRDTIAFEEENIKRLKANL